MKKYLLTRILSITLAFTILSSDISAYAASDITGESSGAQVQTEDVQMEEEPMTENQTEEYPEEGEEPAKEEKEEKPTEDEEPAEDEKEENPTEGEKPAEDEAEEVPAEDEEPAEDEKEENPTEGEKPAEDEKEENPSEGEESAEDETEEIPTVDEEPTEKDADTDKEKMIGVELEEVSYLVPEVETSATAMSMYSLTDGQVSLKKSREIDWIGRLDLTDADIIRDFYDLLAEASDNDGVNDILIDDSTWETEGRITVGEITGTVTVNLSNAADKEVVNREVGAAFGACADEVFENYYPYIMAVRDAFDRDYPEVFWLSGETAVGYQVGGRYVEPEASDTTTQAEYTVTLAMILKDDVEGEAYDIRATEYRSKTEIEKGIALVNSTSKAILDGAVSKNNYEKIRYFNKVLTESNEYNTSENLDAIYHDARECISALDGRTGEDGPVCEAYARAMKVLCDRAGIPCVLVDGMAITKPNEAGEGHMWNYVRLNGSWYGVDVTWNDPTGGKDGAISGYEREEWLLVGSNTEIYEMTFLASHPEENQASSGGVAFTNGPKLSTGKYISQEESEAVPTGYFEREGKKYYADSNGVLQSGWIKIGTEWHYFDASSNFSELECETKDGYLYTLANGKVSYFTNKTTLLKNSWLTHAGHRYYFDENGFAVTGWYEDGSRWYYAETSETAAKDSPIGNMVKGVKKIGEKFYGFHATGYYRLTGWQTIGGERYYFQDDGSAVVNNWYEDGGYWYYADANGCMLKNKELELDGHTYKFDGNYRLITGWQTIGGYRYYFDSKGIMETGLFQVGTYWYYAETEDREENGKTIPKGAIAKGLKSIETDTGVETYIFHSTNYYALTGWQTVSGKRFYLDTDGKARTGLFEVAGKTYYGETDSDSEKNIVRGQLITGNRVIDGKMHIFDASQYYMLSGWQTIGGKRYYIDENGDVLVKAWHQEGDYWYYADENGHLVTTSKEPTEIDGKYYYFDSNYRLGTGWKQVGGKMYFFDFVAEEPEECCALDYTGELGGWLTITKDGRKSYIKTNCQILTGWQTIDGKRYYFDSTGIMETGLFQVGRYYYYAETKKDSTEGIIATGAVEIDGEICGFHPTQYYRISGWQTLNGERYYFQDDCTAVVNDWYQEGNYYYYADAKGQMARNEAIPITNEQTGETHIYYFDNNYRLATGWIKVGDDWRFFDNKDNYLECHEIKYAKNNGWITLNENEGRKSYFNASGSLLKGWQNIDGQRYYFDSIGIMEIGEFKVGNYFYYAEPEDIVVDGVKIPQGAVAKGIKSIETDTGADTYVFHSTSYYRLTGWQTVDGKRFYLDSDGKAKTGLFEVGGKTYYAEEASDIKNEIVKGAVVTGWKEIDNQGEKIIYIFHPTQYYMLTGWQTVSGKKYYINEDGSVLANQWYQEGDYWYYAGADGSMAQGRTQIGNQWYYFDNNYRLSTGWKRIGDIMYFYDSVAEQPTLCYELKSVENPDGWVAITGTKRSYIKSNYQVLTGWQTIGTDRYYFDGTGIALTGEFQVGRYYYYANPTGDNIGALAKNTVVIGGKTYGFHPTQYYRLTGWQTLDGQRYYFKEDCSAATGWFTVDGYWYYADSNGKVQKDIVKLMVNGEEKSYYFDSNYRLTTGWVKIANQWRFFNISDTNTECYELTGDDVTSEWATLTNGKKSYIHARNGILKGWQTIENVRYYFDSTGILQTGWFTDGTYWYYAQDDGCVLKDVQIIDGNRYYFNSNYRLTTGWVMIGKKWKFFNNAESYLKCYELDCTENDGWRELPDGRKSYVNTANNIVKGWLNIGEHRYYFDSNGIMETDWFQVGNYHYYAEPKDTVENTKTIPQGAVAKGVKNIGGDIYGFHPTGYYRLSGWQTLDTKRYYFDEKYQAVTGWYQEGDYWYYADDNGCMAKGLTPIGDDKKEYYFDNNYRLSTGWKRIDKKMYFFDSKAEKPEECYALIATDELGDWIELPNGKRSYIKTNYQVLTGWQNIGTERYYFDSMGILVTGEFQVGRYYYYAKPTGESIGALAKNAEIINGKIYGFHPTQYYRLTGWQTLEGKRYYFKDDCTAVVSDWYQEGNYYYYADKNGHMIQGKAYDIQIRNEQSIETQTYYFDNNYRLTTGWVKVGTEWKFFDNADNYLYCHELNCTPNDGWRVLSDGRKSYVNAANSIVKGWLNIGEHRYYFDSNGIMETGEFKVGNYYYYAEPTDTIVDNKSIPQGAVAKGIKVIGEDTYAFHPTGYYRLTGWQTVNGKRLFLDSTGKATAGLFETGGRTYYAKTASDTVNSGMIGEVLTGRCVIGTDTYVFHPSQYYMLTGWQTINGQRYYIKADGHAIVDAWYQEGDYWYHADKNGYMAKGRTEINGKWYYFDANYRLSTGWKRDGNTMYFFDSVAEQPKLCYELKAVQNPNGWVTITDTKRSYIKSNYQVLTGWQTINGERYYFDSTGIALTGEFQVGRYHYYAEPSGSNAGALAKNVKKINGKYYGFHSTQYYRITGWQTLEGKRYYFQNDCSAVIGWYQEGNYRYYAEADGSMLKNVEREIDGQTYKFDNNYRLIEEQSKNINNQNSNIGTPGQPGWYKVGDYWYYANSNGTAVTGILELKYGEETKTYYFDENCRLQTGWQVINGKKYYIEISETPENYKITYVGSVGAGWQTMDGGKIFYADTKGNVKTGWQTIDRQRYYFDATGILQTGWFTLNGKTYYAEETAHDDIRVGTVAQGAKTIARDANGNAGTETYVFHSSQYYMLTGFQSYGGKRYYLDADGKAKSGWFTVGTDLYYGEKTADGEILKGALAAGAKEIEETPDGKEASETYFFHTTANYRLTGWQTANGKRYYLDMDGTAQTGWFTVSGKIYYGEPETDGDILKGALAAGAKEIEKETNEGIVSNTYFFHASSNYRLTGWQTISGQRYYLNTDGTAQTGWFTISGKTYYGEPTTKSDKILKGTVAKGKVSITEEIDNTTVTKTYYFHPSQYYMMTGWQTIDKQRYYFNTDGVMEIGWFEVSGYHYYADIKEGTEGVVLSGLQEKIFHEVLGVEKTYYFDSSYRLKTGWQTVGGKKYFFENADKPEDCYKTHSGKDIDAGWFELTNGQRCYADTNGNVKTGWQTLDKKRYYFDANGVLQTGWFKVGNYQYYGEPEAENGKEQEIPVGAVASGIKEISGETYCFHTSQYYMLSGWQTVNGQRFYLEADETTRAKAKTGWFTLNGKTYYAEKITSIDKVTKNTVYKGSVAKGAKAIAEDANGNVGEETYVFHSSQYYMLTGFQSFGGKRYYLQTDGKAKTGWFTVGTDTYYGELTSADDVLKGTLATGAREIDETVGTDTVKNTYFFHTSANYRLTGWQTVNGQRYYLNADGIAQTGWFTVSGKIYYGEPSTTNAILKGTLAKGAKEIAGETYVFHPSSYYRLTGWQTVNGQRYYLQTDGTAKTGWFTVSNRTYYAESKANEGIIQAVPAGVVAKGIKEIDGETYVFHTSQYYMLSGWQTISGQRFYLESDETGKAKAKTDWFTLSGKTYYAEVKTYVEDATGNTVYKGTVAKGAKDIDKDINEKTGTETYVFHSSQYYMLTGFQSYGGKRYYLQKDGKAKTGWFTVGTDLYYGEKDTENGVLKGTLAAGAKEIVETVGTSEVRNTYFFHTSANYRLTGWQTVNGQRYYLDTNGIAQTGWFTVSGKIYYGEPSTTDTALKGMLAKGAKEINGETYVFHTSSYYRLTGWQTVNGQRYYLDKDGKAKTDWFTISGKTYYAEPVTKTDEKSNVLLKGTVAKGLTKVEKTIEGSNITVTESYYFHPSQYYKMTGWQTISNQRYYFDADGVMKTGWFEVSGYNHYANPDGTVVKGLVELPYGTESAKKTYYFDNNYRLKTGWQTVAGKKYFFENSLLPEECFATVATYEVDTGWFELENGQICYANNKGVPLTGWQTIDKQRYYFDANGVLQTGWFKVGNYQYYGEPEAEVGEKQEIPVGVVAKGVKVIDGETYCFHTSQYYMLSGWQTVNGQRFYLEADETKRAKAKAGWFTLSGKTYYAEESGSVDEATKNTVYKGTVAKGAKSLAKDAGGRTGEETYVFHSSQYYMLKGFQSYGGKRYYLQSNGKAKTGWFTVGTDLYYGEPTAQNGVLKGTLASGAKEILENEGTEDEVSNTYFFHTTANYRLTGWQTVNGQRYYLNTDGTAQTKWFTVSGKIYYGEPETTGALLKGTLAKGAKEIDNQTYVFHSSQYYRLTGWQTVGTQRYYLNTNGTAKTGWFTVGGKTYYAQKEADMIGGNLKGNVAKGKTTITETLKDSVSGNEATITETYYFHPSQYYKMTGWQTIGKDRYYFDPDGVMRTGWFEVSGYDHYANPDGTVVKGLVELPYGTNGEKKFYYFDNNYRQKTGWQTISSKKYFFTPADTPEECYATYEGSVSHGWMTMENGQICYADSKGNVKTGWQTIGGRRYYFDANGILQTGWFPVGNYRYYAEPKANAGEAQEVPIGAVANGIKEIDGETYIFHSTQYYPLTGFQSYGGKRYYLQADGTAKTGWFTVGTNIYYGEKTASEGVYKGTLAAGAKEIVANEGTENEARDTYFFHTTGNYRMTGWQTIDDKRYYLQANGKAKTGWFNQGGYWYYGAESAKGDTLLKGLMVKDLRTITVLNGEEIVDRTYYFDANYRLATGWKVINGIRYFFQIDKNPINCYLIIKEPTASGWREFENGTKSYFNAQGNPVTGWQTIEGKKYYFDTNGIMQTGWCTINGVEYYFNADGIYIPMTAPAITSLTSTFYKTVDIKWNPISGAQRYILEYSTNSVFPGWETTSVLLDDTSVNSYRIEELEEDTTYYFRLRYTTWSDNTADAALYYSQYSAVKSIKVRGEVAATATSATLSECQIISGSRDGGITVQLQASLKERLKSADDKYYIVETESYGNAIDLATPVGSLDKDFDINTTVVIDAGDGSSDPRECVDRALMNKFALAILNTNGTYQVISTPMGITNPEAISENTAPILKPTSKKGLQGIFIDNPQNPYSEADALGTNSKNTLFNLDLAYVVGTGPATGYNEYVYKGKTYYFSDCSHLTEEFKELNKGCIQYIQGYDPDNPKYNKVAATITILLSYKKETEYLIDPAARNSKSKAYYTLNVREEKARETLEAVFLYLGEVFGRSDCYVTHWVLGNEVNSSRAWNYQGSLSFDAYMQSYTTAFRLLYNGVKAAKTGNNVYISLDNGWTAAPDTYAGKTTLDKFAALAQQENPDMLWSIAYHGYSYPLTRCDFWNDHSNTTNSLSTRYISMKNIYVLTDYVTSLEAKYEKPVGSIRVILSEQGYNAGQGHYVQAQALARGYYMAEFNDRIDAFIIRAAVDADEETRGGLYLGIMNKGEEKRIAFYVYEYMDSNIDAFCAKAPSDIAWSQQNQNKVAQAQQIIGNTNWESIIPNFSRSKLAAMY